jgi:predicted acyl esterase
MRWRADTPNHEGVYFWDRFRATPAKPLKPGEKYKVGIVIGLVAYVINIGHSIRVRTSAQCFLPALSVPSAFICVTFALFDFNLSFTRNMCHTNGCYTVLFFRHVDQVTISGSNWPYFSANPNSGELLPIPPVGRHSVWPTWPDRTVNVTAVNTVFHEGSVLNVPVLAELNEAERLDEDGLFAR